MIHRTDTLDHPGLAPYSRLTEQALRNTTPEGLFIAESPKVIHVAIEAGYTPESMLCEERHIDGDAAGIIAQFPDMPVYTGSPDLLAQLTGYRLTRGVLCAMRRRPLPTVEDTVKGARLVAVLDNVCDITVSVVGRNLWMLYNKAPFDPEAVATTSNYYQGIDYFMMPSLRSVGFNLRVKF